jgi:hypothetical protein
MYVGGGGHVSLSACGPAINAHGSLDLKQEIQIQTVCITEYLKRLLRQSNEFQQQQDSPKFKQC